MIALLTCLMMLTLLVLIVRWFASIPLVRTLSIAIDNWADSVHGSESERLR